MSDSAKLREQLLALLRGGEAHMSVEDALGDWPVKLRGARPAGSPHTPWQLLEHLRVAQWDILEFCRNPKHVSPKFPDGYWPPTDTPPDDAAWHASVSRFRADLRAMEQLVTFAPDLHQRVAHPEAEAKHTLLREALILADHNSYHLGQLVLLRRMLGT